MQVTINDDRNTAFERLAADQSQRRGGEVGGVF